MTNKDVMLQETYESRNAGNFDQRIRTSWTYACCSVHLADLGEQGSGRKVQNWDSSSLTSWYLLNIETIHPSIITYT
jgi:hypothetical protein